MTVIADVIRKASIEDAHLILKFIKKMAIYERQVEKVTCQEVDIRKHFFSDKPLAYAAFVMDGGEEIGFALYYLQFDSMSGQRAMFLHDLYIEAPFRRKGFGHKLMKFLKVEAINFGCNRISWQCYKWNFLAQSFYAKFEAKEETDKTNFVMSLIN